MAISILNVNVKNCEGKASKTVKIIESQQQTTNEKQLFKLTKIEDPPDSQHLRPREGSFVIII